MASKRAVRKSASAELEQAGSISSTCTRAHQLTARGTPEPVAALMCLKSFLASGVRALQSHSAPGKLPVHENIYIGWISCQVLSDGQAALKLWRRQRREACYGPTGMQFGKDMLILQEQIIQSALGILCGTHNKNHIICLRNLYLLNI